MLFHSALAGNCSKSEAPVPMGSSMRKLEKNAKALKELCTDLAIMFCWIRKKSRECSPAFTLKSLRISVITRLG